jgi:hypothetical protein
MKDKFGRELFEGAFIVYPSGRAGLAVYQVTVNRERSVQAQECNFDPTAPDGFKTYNKVSLSKARHMVMIPKELLPIYANAPEPKAVP